MWKRVKTKDKDIFIEIKKSEYYEYLSDLIDVKILIASYINGTKNTKKADLIYKKVVKFLKTL
jgi:hypothetical protein